MRDAFLNRIKEIQHLAKSGKKAAAPVKSTDSKETALSRVITTQEDADLFMKRLQALG